MNRRLNELHLRRGRLLERIATQRAVVVHDMQPVRLALDTTDRWLACVRSGVDYIKQRPAIITLAVVVLFVFKARRIWRLAKRGFVAWRTWRFVREKMWLFGLRAQP